MNPHPAAALFPMLDDDALNELAANIKDQGLIHPIVRWKDADGVVWLLDGRNRAEACLRAGIKPDVVDWTGDDPAAYVLSANEHRRHLTPSQRAMLHVRLNGNVDKRLSTRDGATAANTTQPMIVHARKVADHAPDLIDAVIAGTIPVKRAADEAERRRANKEQLASLTADDARWLTYVRRQYPALAERYDAGTATRPELQNEIDGIEQNAVTQPKLAVDRVNAAADELRSCLADMRTTADRWPLGDHTARLIPWRDLVDMARTIRDTTKERT